MAPSERLPVYADEDIDRFLVSALRERDFDLLTTAEARRQQSPDDQQLQHATSIGRVLLSDNRRDFRRLHARAAQAGRSHAPIVLLPQGGPVQRRAIRAAMLLDWLALEAEPISRVIAWNDLQLRLHRGERLEGYPDEEVRLALGEA